MFKWSFIGFLFLFQHAGLLFAQQIDKLTGRNHYGFHNFHEGLAKVYYGNMCGFVDSAGVFKLGSGLSINGSGSHEGFSDGLVLIYDNTGKRIFIKKNGEKVIPVQNYAYIGNFSESLAVASDANEKHGFIDTEGKEVIPLLFNDAAAFSEGRAAVQIGEKFGYINTAGQLVISAKYEEADYFYYGMAKVKKDGKYGFIDTKGNVIIDFIYENASCFFTDYVWFCKDGKWGMMNKKQKVIITPQYDDFETFVSRFQFPAPKKHLNSKLLFPVVKAGKQGFVDETGAVIVPFIYDNVFHFNEDIAGVFVRGKGWGYIDITGKEIITPQYDFAFNFSEGFSVVEKGEYYFIINKKGDCVINCE